MEEVEKVELEKLEERLNFLKEKLRGRIDLYELARIVDEERRER